MPESLTVEVCGLLKIKPELLKKLFTSFAHFVSWQNRNLKLFQLRGFWEDLLPDLDQNLKTFLDSLGDNLVSLNGPKHRQSYCTGFGGHPSGTACKLLPHGARHRPTLTPEPRTHCTSLGSYNRSRDYTFILNSSHCATAYSIEVCASIHGYVSPNHHWPTTKTDQADRQHNILHSFYWPFHLCCICSG